MKIKVGILFGGFSKEREISFAGGRTVYDNLDKSLFEPVPIFVDSFGNFCLLDWAYIYKGSIRDFYPPVASLPDLKTDYQVYAESLHLEQHDKQLELLNSIGRPVGVQELRSLIDIAFLCLHGPYGEDGKLQGLLDYLKIPYTGSGVLPSAIGINKAVQKKLMRDAGFNSPAFFSFNRDLWLSSGDHRKEIFSRAQKEIGFPLVVKAASQGSSIGVSIIAASDEEQFFRAVNKSLFIQHITRDSWHVMRPESRHEYVRQLADIREGIGMPVSVFHKLTDEGAHRVIHHPELLREYLDASFETEGVTDLWLFSHDADDEVLVEGFIEGKEFSCIVVQNEQGEPVALPPTEIRKGKELFDYRSKYLPGLSRKITPIDLPESGIENIRKECNRLFSALHFNVYARIDGFYTSDDRIFLNDPNTTSGMMPSSFFFHQAAEIGLNPSQFLTFIIRTSLNERMKESKNDHSYRSLLRRVDEALAGNRSKTSEKINVAVILGGYSSERHISVESGRNIYEKLSSSEKYRPVPVFLTGSNEKHLLYRIPVNILLKDNADDIREKIDHYSVHPSVKKIIEECRFITEKYSSSASLDKPAPVTYEDLAREVKAVFIALHGRPGEDGAVQEKLDLLGLPYNGSGKGSSSVTINKFLTNEILHKHGFLVAKHRVISKEEWERDASGIVSQLSSDLKYPYIAKPVDDGCSSAVRKIKNAEELNAFARLIFRSGEELDPEAASILKLKQNEEFPFKKEFLVEELIGPNGADHFLEITGGMLTRYNEKGELEYEVFEASEALSEGEVLSLEEKFLAGQGQNITPARYARNRQDAAAISKQVRETLGAAARVLNVEGYCRIDAFVRVFPNNRAEVVFIEVNSLPGMTPATCIFHQTALNGYKPYDFIDRILDFGMQRNQKALSRK